MLRRVTCLFTAILLILSLSGVCFADNSKVGNISVSVFSDHEWKPVHQESRYAHLTDGFYGDGILAFADLEICLSNGLDKALTEYMLDDDFSLKAVVEEPFDDKTTVSFHAYTWDGKKLHGTIDELEGETSEKGEWQINDWAKLEDGRYLIEAAYTVSMDEFYYSGSALFWLRVGENPAPNPLPEKALG